MPRRRIAFPRSWVALVLATVLVACGTERSPAARAPTADRPVEVASFDFPESELVAEIYGQALAASGVPVRMQLDLGTREMVLPAFQAGLVDIVPEYLGSALSAISQTTPNDLSDPSVVAAALERALAPYGEALMPSAAEDQNGFAVLRRTADRLGLRTVSDLRKMPHLSLTGPPECRTRDYCMLGLQRIYGLQIAGFTALDTERERVTALDEGVADVALLFSTDADLARGDVVFLIDDRHLQPSDNLTPIVSWSALNRFHQRIVTVLDAVSARLTTGGLIFLNSRLALGGRQPSEEAHGWLVRQGLVPRHT